MNPSANFRASLAWWWKQLFIGVVFLAAVVGLVTGSFLLYTEVLADGPDTSGKIPFQDVLLAVLAIGGVFISGFGVLAFQVLSRTIEAKIFRRSERNRRLAETRGWINTGMLYFELYRISSKRDPDDQEDRQFLNRALIDTKNAYQLILENLDDRDWEVERLLTIIRNNWGYFILEVDSVFETVSATEIDEAVACLDYIEKRATKFPDIADEVVDTKNKVAGRFRPAT